MFGLVSSSSDARGCRVALRHGFGGPGQRSIAWTLSLPSCDDRNASAHPANPGNAMLKRRPIMQHEAVEEQRIRRLRQDGHHVHSAGSAISVSNGYRQQQRMTQSG
jgi:hypothetical protein